MTPDALPVDGETVEDPIALTRLWLERVVIGLNLCPFAKAVYVKEQVRYVLSDATTAEALVEQLAEELVLLRDTPAEDIDTTLLIHPQVLTDFLDYNDFLDNADAAIEALDLQGVRRWPVSIPITASRAWRRRMPATTPTGRPTRSCTCCAKPAWNVRWRPSRIRM